MPKKRKNKHHGSAAEREALKQSRKDIATRVATLAKRANQRLREIEKQDLADASPAYRYIERLHYDEDNATATDSKGRMKFNTNTRKKTYAQLQHEEAILTRFLEAKTSRAPGVRQMYEKATESLNKSTNRNLTVKEYGDMFLMDNMLATMKAYGSKEVVKITTKAIQDGLTTDEINEILNEVNEDDTLLDLMQLFNQNEG